MTVTIDPPPGVADPAAPPIPPDPPAAADPAAPADPALTEVTPVVTAGTDPVDPDPEETEDDHEGLSAVAGLLVLLGVAYVLSAVAGFFLYGHPRIITCLAFGAMGMGAVGLVIALVALVRAGWGAVSEAIE